MTWLDFSAKANFVIINVPFLPLAYLKLFYFLLSLSVSTSITWFFLSSAWTFLLSTFSQTMLVPFSGVSNMNKQAKHLPVHLRWPHMQADQVHGLGLREIGGGFTKHHRASSIRSACYAIAKPLTMVQKMQNIKKLRGHRDAVYCGMFLIATCFYNNILHFWQFFRWLWFLYFTKCFLGFSHCNYLLVHLLFLSVYLVYGCASKNHYID